MAPASPDLTMNRGFALSITFFRRITTMAKCTVTANALALAFTFAHGEITNVSLDQFPAEIQQRFALYGMRQKLQDSYSGVKDPAEAQETLNKLVDRLLAGEWASTSRAGGGSSSALSRLIEAICTVTGKGAEEVTPMVEALDETQLKALRARPQIALELANIRARELAAKVAAQGGESGLEGLFAQV
jgi:hypothetical protein